MSKGMAMLIGLTLLALPARASAQEIGVSFQVRERPAQPDLIVGGPVAGGAAARVPGGWAYGVSGGAGSIGLTTAVRPSHSVDVTLGQATTGDPRQSVTVMFVPL